MHSPIRIGNQTAHSAARVLEPFQFALANGFEAFEWFPDKKNGGAGWDETDLDAATRGMIRGAARVEGMRLSVHARWPADPSAPEAYPGLLGDLELAEALGASVLNVHLRTEAGVAAYAKALLPLLAQATARGLRLAIENTPETTPQDFNDLFARLRAMHPPGLAKAGMCLDLGHANLCAATRNHYLGYIRQLDQHVPIIHAHLHENRGDADSHLTLFTGPAGADSRGIREFLEWLCARHYAGSLILEQWPQPPALLLAARDRLRQMLDAL